MTALYVPRLDYDAPAPAPHREALRDAFFAAPLREAAATVVGSRAQIMVIREGPGNLADRQWYTGDSLQKAVQQRTFEGAQSFLDHAGDPSIRDLAGAISGVRLGTFDDPEQGQVAAVYGVFNPTSSAAGATALSLCKDAVAAREAGTTPALIGWSINAFGIGEPATIDGEEWNRVDLITEVLSVDLVTKAGAGGSVIGLLESACRRRRSSVFEEAAQLRRARELHRQSQLFRPVLY